MIQISTGTAEYLGYLVYWWMRALALEGQNVLTMSASGSLLISSAIEEQPWMPGGCTVSDA